MEENCRCKSKIISTFAGYYKEDDVLKKSSSGGMASAIAEAILNDNGVVYGVTYSDDFYCAHYLRAIDEGDLSKLKGSKYCYVHPTALVKGESLSVYDLVCGDLYDNKRVLFWGLGCAIAALLSVCKKKRINIENLYTAELVCDGCTGANVHSEYVKDLELLYGSKVIDFNVRNKRDGWIPPYIYARFENDCEHIVPFYSSSYGIAFLNYKRSCCYQCLYKGENHPADVAVGDYWGCNVGMKEYNKWGVSVAFIQTRKGEELIYKINPNFFQLYQIDTGYALFHNPRYNSSHIFNPRWKMIDTEMKKGGLKTIRKSYKDSYLSQRMKDEMNHPVVLWGCGRVFHRLAPFIIRMADIRCVVDNDRSKWGKKTEYGILCQSPEYIKGKAVFVIIMNDDPSSISQIINQLIDMGVTGFEYVDNWLNFV